VNHIYSYHLMPVLNQTFRRVE